MRELRIDAVLLGAIISVCGFSDLCGALTAERLVRPFGFGCTLIGAALVPAIAACCRRWHTDPLHCAPQCSPWHNWATWRSYAHDVPGVLPAGALLGSALAEATGLRAAMFVGAGGFLLSTLWLICSPIRRLRELPRDGAAKS